MPGPSRFPIEWGHILQFARALGDAHPDDLDPRTAVAPPTFILFTNRQVKLHFAFQRFLENQIRAAFGFRGSPIWFKVRARDK